jgi:hypothetical protein
MVAGSTLTTRPRPAGTCNVRSVRSVLLVSVLSSYKQAPRAPTRNSIVGCFVRSGRCTGFLIGASSCVGSNDESLNRSASSSHTICEMIDLGASLQSDTRLCMAELLASLSLAIDLGVGQPIEWVLRSCLLAVRLSEALSLSERYCQDASYLSLLRHMDGSALSSERSAMTCGGRVAPDLVISQTAINSAISA